MTKEQIDAIRARLDAATPGDWTENPFQMKRNWAADSELVANAPTDLRTLLDEVERLTAEREILHELTDRAAAEQAQKARDAAFQRGAEAMRESAARRCEVSPIHGERTTTARHYADAVRALPLPIPEDKP
jgi:hypothetical protein